MQLVKVAFISSFLLFAVGCTTTTSFNPQYLADYQTQAASEKSADSILVYSSPEDSARLWTGKASTYVGGGASATFEVGKILEEAMKEQAEANFSGTINTADKLDGAKGYDHVVRARLVNLKHGFPSDLIERAIIPLYAATHFSDFKTTCMVDAMIEVDSYDKSGNLVSTKQYAVLMQDAVQSMSNKVLYETQNRLVHSAMAHLAEQALRDIKGQ